jgi:hypothetical protein
MLPKLDLNAQDGGKILGKSIVIEMNSLPLLVNSPLTNPSAHHYKKPTKQILCVILINCCVKCFNLMRYTAISTL